MRSFQGFSGSRGSLLADFSAQIAEGAAMRKAAEQARAAREEAERSVRSRSEFLANMNHELRTPLNAIIGFSTMLRDAEAYGLAEPQKTNYAEFILQSADLLLSHVNTILSVAALEARSVVADTGAVDVARLLGEAADRAAVAAAAAGVALDVRTGDAPDALADAQRLGQALDHVLRAAIASSARGGKIVARVSRGPSGVELAVRDFGAGFDRDEIKRMLSVFGETHRGLDRALGGPALGLAIAKSFVELMGGAFAVDSRKGKGTIARLTLPVAQPAVGDEEAQRLAR